jgi:HEAT repeat protein
MRFMFPLYVGILLAASGHEPSSDSLPPDARRQAQSSVNARKAETQWRNRANRDFMVDTIRLHLLECSAAGASNESVLSILLKALHDPDHNIRLEATSLLSDLGLEAVQACRTTAAYSRERDKLMAGLRSSLTDKHPRVREAAARALRDIGEDSSYLLRELTDSLGDQDSQVQTAAIEALISVGPTANVALPRLVELLTNVDVHVRVQAAEAVWKVGKRPELAVPVLRRALHDATARRAALLMLAELGPPASDTLPDLRLALKDPDPETRVLAADAVWKVSRREQFVIPVLTASLQSTDRGCQLAALRVLASIGPAARKVSRTIQPLAKEKDVIVRLAAVYALEKVDPQSATAAIQD